MKWRYADSAAYANDSSEFFNVSRFTQWTDQNGNQAVTALTLEGISTKAIQKATNAPTGMASIAVNSQGENSIVVVSGANWKLSANDINREAAIITAADVLLTQLETPLESVAAAIQCAQAGKVTVILNPAPAQTLPTDLLQHVDIITPNRIEAEMLTGITITDDQSLIKSARILHSYGIKIVLITLGRRGVFLSSPGKSKLIPAIKVAAVDTVGAGDVFNGVLAAHYSKNRPIETVVSLAIVAAGISVTRVGAQAAIPDIETVKAYQFKHSEVILD